MNSIELYDLYKIKTDYYFAKIAEYFLTVFENSLNDGALFAVPSNTIFDHIRMVCKKKSQKESQLNNLTSQISNVHKYYKEGKEYKLIDNLILPELKKLNYSPSEIKKFFIESAESTAYNETLYSLDNYYMEIYKLMYENEKFSGYKSLSEFKILKYEGPPNNHPLYYELNQLNQDNYSQTQSVSKPKLKLEQHEIILPKYNETNWLKISEVNFFCVPEELIYKLASKKYYSYLCDSFIDDNYTTYLDYLKVMFINPEYHRSCITFLGSNQLCCLLFEQLNQQDILKITKSLVGKMKLFRSKNISTYISQTGYSKALKPSIKDNDNNHSLVENAIKKLYDIELLKI